MADRDVAKQHKEDIDQSRRKFLITLSSIMGGIAAIFASIPFLSAWLPSARAKAAGAPVEVDISNLQAGEQMTVEWRGKPVWIVRRSKEALLRLQNKQHLAQLRDPNSQVTAQQPDYVSQAHRAIKAEYLVLVGICTHLGCSPVYRPYLNKLGDDWPGGFFCPCHGSYFDLAGRVFKGVPAPINLEVPPYAYKNKHTIIIGVDQGKEQV